MIKAFLFFICLGCLFFGKPVVDLWDDDLGLQDAFYERENFTWSIREKNSHIAVLSDQHLGYVQKTKGEKYEKIVACLITPRTISPKIYDYVTSHIEKYDLILTSDEELLRRYSNKCRKFNLDASRGDSVEVLNLLDEIWGKIESFFMPNLNCDLSPFLRPIANVYTPSGVFGIDCIYVINLAERPEKWDRMEKVASQNNLIINRFNAVNGWKLSSKEEAKEVTKFGNTYKKAPNCYLSWGGIGCYLSHLSVIKDAYERGFNSIWVMEDDVVFNARTLDISNVLIKLNGFDPEWDVFYTDPNNRDPTGKFRSGLYQLIIPPRQLKSKGQDYYNQMDVIDADLARIRVRGGTYSMILSRKGIKKIYESLSNLPIVTPYDDVLHFVDDIREYVARMPMVTHVFDENGGVPSDTWSPP